VCTLAKYLPKMSICTCVRRFYNGRDMFKGYHRSRRPKSEMDSNIIAAINSLVEEDATNKVHVLVETFGTSSGVVFQIVRNWFGMRKIYTRLVPHFRPKCRRWYVSE
jgi:hypothetical protein